MDIRRSINKRNKRQLSKIKGLYLQAIKNGKTTSYYFRPSLYKYYLKRLFWLLTKLVTFDPKPFKTFYRIISSNYFPYHSIHGVYRNNVFNEFFRALFGYSFLKVNNLYPAYPAHFISAHQYLFFERFINPKVSIIIPVYNNLSYTYNCLLSIRDRVSKKVQYEIIVIDDCSTDETQSFFENNVSGVKYIRNTENLGYLRSNNKATDLAEGEYICLLNNDTEVQQNWLESLLDVIERDNSIGCVGSKLVYPNNILQEAGGIIYKNGDGANFGRRDEVDWPAYNFIREVDYCSAASILFRKSDFEKLGKFDVQFAPAYYEDTDLCFSIRNVLKKKVVYHPLSKVIHFEGMSSGKEIKEGSVKNYQALNRIKFIEKWKIPLRKHDVEGYRKSYRRLLPSNSILVIEWFLPPFDKDSGSLRMFRILGLFKSLGYHVIFIPENGALTEPYYSAMIKAGIEVRTDLNSNSSVNEFEAVDYFSSVKYIWSSRPDINALYKDKIWVFKNAKWIYDTVDLHHVRLFREAKLNPHSAARLAEARKMKELEIDLAKEADATITVTRVEKDTLEKYGVKNVHIVPNVHIPIPNKILKSFSDRSGLVFIGSYQHPPNIDAVRWLVDSIMPLVWKDNPDITLNLLGSSPTPEVLALANERVLVPGYIHDVSSYFDNSKIFVAPLRYGAGMKGKIGQALEHKLPIISTSIGAEGMGLEDGEHFLLADDAVQFANQILKLYNDIGLWTNVQEGSESAILQFTPQVVKASLKRILADLDAVHEVIEYDMEMNPSKFLIH